MGGSTDACPTHAQYVGQEFMRDAELIGVRPIAGHQQPAGKPRLDEMEAGSYDLSSLFIVLSGGAALNCRLLGRAIGVPSENGSACIRLVTDFGKVGGGKENRCATENPSPTMLAHILDLSGLVRCAQTNSAGARSALSSLVTC